MACQVQGSEGAVQVGATKQWARWTVEGDNITIIVTSGEAIGFDSIGAEVRPNSSTCWLVRLPSNSEVEYRRHELFVKSVFGEVAISLDRVVRIQRAQDTVWSRAWERCVPQ